MTITKIEKPFDNRNWHKVHYLSPRIVAVGDDRYIIRNDHVERRSINKSITCKNGDVVINTEWEHRLLK